MLPQRSGIGHPEITDPFEMFNGTAIDIWE